MKPNLIVTTAFLFVLSIQGMTQSLIGSWQLVKETTCLENELPPDTTAIQDLVSDMKAMNDKTPKVVKFIDQQSGEESTRILNSRKKVNTKHFLYKISDTYLYILDKKSRTITETYNIDSFQNDTLILSNIDRACETKVFVRVK